MPTAIFVTRTRHGTCHGTVGPVVRRRRQRDNVRQHRVAKNGLGIVDEEVSFILRTDGSVCVRAVADGCAAAVFDDVVAEEVVGY